MLLLAVRHAGPFAVTLFALLSVVACTEARVELLVDLRTDIVPGHEFSVVETTLVGPGHPAGDPVETPVLRDAPTIDGMRIAEFADLKEGRYVMQVTLRNASGGLVVERPVELQLKKSFAVTVLITRDCRGVRCDSLDPSQAACLRGMCVSQACTPETPERCPPPVCDESDATGCPPPEASCAEAQCASLACFYAPRIPSACEEGFYCDPEEGCHESGSGRPDGGPDGGSPDAALNDGGSDARAADASGTDSGPWMGGLRAVTGGGPLDDFALAVAADATRVIAAGSYIGPVEFFGAMWPRDPAGSDNAFVVFLKHDLGYLSERHFASAGYNTAWALAFDSAGGALAAGQFGASVDFGGGSRSTGDVAAFAVRYASDGSHAWDWISVGGGSFARGICTDGSGQPVVVGDFRSDVDFGAGMRSAGGAKAAFIVWLDAAGSYVDDWTLDTGSSATFTAVSCHSSGRFVAVGGYVGTAMVDGNHRSMGRDVIAIGFDETRAVSWVWTAASAGFDNAHDVALDESGNAYVVGSYSGDIDFGRGSRTGHGTSDEIFVVKLDDTGSPQWDWTLGSNGTDRARGLAVNATGEPVVVGEFGADMDFGGGLRAGSGGTAFAAGLTADAGYRWDWVSTGDPTGRAVAHDVAAASGRAFVVGTFGAPAELGTGSIPTDSSDFFVLSHPD